jgi:hypothetical protein
MRIGKDKLWISAAFLVVVISATLIRMLSAEDRPQSTSQPVRPEPLTQTDVGEFRGIALQLHNGDESCPYETYIDEIAQTGANTLSLVLAAFQENGSSSSIFLDLRKTPGDEHLARLIRHAHERNLRVVLMPIVLLENAREGEWRGKINPGSWNDWWEDYTSILMHYAELAERCQVEVFMVGSELISTEKMDNRWRELIGKIRSRFSGRLAYSSNWDHYRPITWWDAVDIAGMTTYYDLTGGKEPTLDLLTRSWEKLRKEILAWQRDIGRPILFTEVGWPNQIGCAQYPWNYYANPDKPDPLTQANCFEAFFRTWINEPAIAGYLVWEWRNHPGQKVGLEDTSYVPMDKPAIAVIEKYFQMPSPNASAGQPAEAISAKDAQKKGGV